LKVKRQGYIEKEQKLERENSRMREEYDQLMYLIYLDKKIKIWNMKFVIGKMDFNNLKI
jgi:hypothetical protein